MTTDDYVDPDGLTLVDILTYVRSLCTCGTRAPSINLDHATSTPTRDIDCPVHGLEALIFEVRYPDEEGGASRDHE